MLDTDTLELQLSKWKGKEARTSPNNFGTCSICGTAKPACRQSCTLILPLGSTTDTRLLGCRSQASCEQVKKYGHLFVQFDAPWPFYDCSIVDRLDVLTRNNNQICIRTVSRTVDVPTADGCW